MMTDPISDMITRIRNAQAVKKETVTVPFSNLKWNILEVLKRYNYVKEINKIGRGNKKNIEITLKYTVDKLPKINSLVRISKPSRRVYVDYKKIWPFKEKSGLRIISTSKGVLSDSEAKKMKLGGEVLIEIH
ncbi:MAG: 30S ribosomal protein S8 [Parcubacteria group bacterium]|nr:30S ribosomal protein S8 [Parcubacteria group bacterium]